MMFHHHSDHPDAKIHPNDIDWAMICIIITIDVSKWRMTFEYVVQRSYDLERIIRSNNQLGMYDWRHVIICRMD